MLNGKASVFLSVSGSDYSKRLRSYGVGTILGEMGFYNDLPRSADVVSDLSNASRSFNPGKPRKTRS